MNKDLINYIEQNIFIEYKKNDEGHRIEHIKYVIERSLKFANQVENINYNMVYTIAAYHDIGHHIDAKNHQKVSANILRNDQKIKEFFNEEEINIIAEAIEDHRASNNQEPRTIYGKIVSSADRNTSLENAIRRTYTYKMKNDKFKSLKEIIEDSYNHLKNKFGQTGYAKSKMYFKDDAYEKFLNEMEKLCQDKEKFIEKYLEVNNLKDIYNKE